jgi:RimJ/RimL family protein N-acetyltransferase
VDKKPALQTNRLLLELISESDGDFIIELVNTDGWLKFIGDRNIHSEIDAVAYIKKILDNQNMIYWTVKLKDTKSTIGIITFIKRDYLEQKDIGFAFLPDFSKKGYAYEATNAVLNFLIQHNSFTDILAVTISENNNSIKLLQKLGFRFETKMEIDNEALIIYSSSVDELLRAENLILSK